MNIKTFEEIMAGIDFAISVSPRYRLQYMAWLDEQIDKINDELALEGIPRKQVDAQDVAKKYGIKYIETPMEFQWFS